MEFLNLAKPKIALIGVGEKNTFGHPNQGTLDKLKSIRLGSFQNRFGGGNKHHSYQ